MSNIEPARAPGPNASRGSIILGGPSLGGANASAQTLRANAPKMHSGLREVTDLVAVRPALVHAGFVSTEHMLLGNAATRNERVTELRFKDGTTLSFGEVVALAGDYFGTVDELRQLVATEEGQAELRWSRWFALARKTEPEPPVPQETKRRALERYARLVADNANHFSHGGTAIEEYERIHGNALRKAYQAGATGDDALFAAAVTDEAFCHHFLSDTFAAGHVRAPVAEIRETYRRELPDAIDQALRYIIRVIIQHLDARGDVPWYWPHWLIEKKAIETIQGAAGTIIGAFTLGDLVALAWHDADGKGLKAISSVDPSGVPVPGGFRWCAPGDGQLKPGTNGWRMAVAAMRVSRAELDAARALGMSDPKAAVPSWSAAKLFIPRADPVANPVFEWRWGAMNNAMVDAVNAVLRDLVVPQLRSFPPDPAVLRFDRLGNPDPNGVVVLHVGEAFEAFVREIEVDGIKMVERAVAKSATRSRASGR